MLIASSVQFVEVHWITDMTMPPSVGRLPVVKLKTVAVGLCTLTLVMKNELYVAVLCRYQYQVREMSVYSRKYELGTNTWRSTSSRYADTAVLGTLVLFMVKLNEVAVTFGLAHVQ